jgi:hypothetical protein
MKRLLPLILLMLSTSCAAAPPPLTRITVAVVADESVTPWYGSDEATRAALAADMRIATDFISQLGVALEVVSVETGTERPPSMAPTDVLAFIAPRPADITLLVTGSLLANHSRLYRGYALPYSVCGRRGRAVVSVQGDDYNGETIAHEIAHVLGAMHDGILSCTATSSEAFIMSPSVTGNMSFSQCSIDDVAVTLAIPGCLAPVASVSPPPAGSGGGGAFEWIILAWLAALGFIILVCHRNSR